MKNSTINKLIHSHNLFDRLLLRLYLGMKNSELPCSEQIGKNIFFPHGLKGIVINPNTIIEDNVIIFHQVTCGRGDVYGFFPNSKQLQNDRVILKEGCILCAGAKILNGDGILVVGKNTIVGANAVLTQSTGDNEVWGGVPAKLIKKHNYSYNQCNR